MTTPAAAAYYEARHNMEMEGKGYAVYNPNNLPLQELPYIIGFNNGGSEGFMSAISIAEDGKVLGGHMCSSEGYMRHDLGILEGTRDDRHETYRAHYPNGYRMDFVSHANVKKDERLIKAFELNKAQEENNGASE